MNEKSKNTVPNIWSAQENVIHFYKILSVAFGILAIFVLILAVVAFFRDPIVVMKSVSKKEFYPSERATVSIEKSDIEEATKQFIEALYVWSEFNPTNIGKELSPYAEDAFIGKFVDVQVQKYGKELKGKKLSQAITFVKVNVFDDRVVSSFLRILLIDGIPLAIPTEVTLSLIQGSPTRLNPMGIYVSGILEHEGSK